jgi:hypothetical protein
VLLDSKEKPPGGGFSFRRAKVRSENDRNGAAETSRMDANSNARSDDPQTSRPIRSRCITVRSTVKDLAEILRLFPRLIIDLVMQERRLAVDLLAHVHDIAER